MQAPKTRGNPAAATMLFGLALIVLKRADIGVATTSRMGYSLTSRASGAPLLTEVSVEQCSKYAFAAWERLQISAECSIRNNIEVFLQKLSRLRADA